MLKEELLVENRLNYNDKEEAKDISRIHSPIFVPIQSKVSLYLSQVGTYRNVKLLDITKLNFLF